MKTAVEELAEEMGVGGILVRRWIGCWVDFLALAAVVFGGAFAFTQIPQLAELPANYAIVPVLVAPVLYFPVLEGFWGRTLGKLVTGLKVVNKHGRAPGIGRAALRTVLRFIEVNPVLLGGIPAGIAVLCTKRKQRLGDLVAETYVVDVTTLKQKVEVDATLAAMRG